MKAQTLFEILEANAIDEQIGSLEKEIMGLQTDSRLITKDQIFIALKGEEFDGHDFINAAIRNGANVILCEEISSIEEGITYLKVKDLKNVVGVLAHHFYGNDLQDYMLIGVTGTNGKSTIVTLLQSLFKQLGHKVGLLSTIKNVIGENEIEATHTTPDPITLARLINQMRLAGCSHIFMEVSSHGLDQGRVNGLSFDGGIFTNLTHDHLDYHGSMLNYINAKKIFFDQLDNDAFALVNIDDKNGKVMVQNSKAKILSYGLRSMANYRCKILEDSILGLHLKINNIEAFYRMSGEFNAYNLTAVFGTAIEAGEDQDEVIKMLSTLEGVEGRMQKVVVQNSKICGIVDYAHTPDALMNVVTTLNKTMSRHANLITVIGAGGDRDKLKRPIMAQVAVKYSHQVILTSDNPRSEDPEIILDEMEEGVPKEGKSKVVRITDRASAIKTAVMLAKANDVVLIAGKGHEKYQEIDGIKHPFQDKKILLEALSGKS